MKPNLRLFTLIGLSIFIYSLVGVTHLLSNTEGGIEKRTPALVPGLLIDASVSSTNPSASSNLYYSIRYRCASLIEDCIDPYVSMVFPDGVDVITISSGGNISNTETTVLGNGHTEVTFYLENPGSQNVLTAGSSGRLEVCLNWDCVESGGAQVPMAGSNFNFISNPTFFASGTSVQAANAPDVIVPVFLECLPPPEVSGTDLEKTNVDLSEMVHPGGISSWNLERPAHTGPVSFYDTIPTDTYFVDYIGENVNTIELLIGGTWYDIGIGQINNWIKQNNNNGTLDNLVASGIQTGASVVFLNESSTSLGSYYIDGPTALRITTPAGSVSGTRRPLSLYVDPTTAIGTTIQNCISSSDLSLGRSCAETNVGDPEAVIMDFRKHFVAGLGDPYPTGYPFNRVTPMEKQSQDLVYRLTYAHGNGNNGAVSGLVISDTLPTGFDFVQGVNGNDWRVFLHPKNNINEPFALDTQPGCETPTFSKSVDSATGKTIVKWIFSNCTFYSGFSERQQFQILFTTRYMGVEVLGSSISNCAEATFVDDTQIYCDVSGAEIRGNCPSKITTNLPSIDASVTATKFVQGKLDSVYSRFPNFGDTDTSGVATYELYIYNYGSEGLKKLEVVDILPNIGDFSLTTETPRGSDWNLELAGPIVVERITNGGVWTDDATHISGDILYSTTYNPCYKDNTDQVKVATGLLEPSSQSCGSGDFDALNPVVGAKAFAFIWEDISAPIMLGEGIRIRFDVYQNHSEIDPSLNDVAWNSFAVTGTQVDNLELFSTEPLKVGIRNISTNSSGVGNLIWNDQNANGRQDVGEPGIGGAHISIYESNGDTVFVGGVPLSTISDGDGEYEFLGLNPMEDYIVRMDNFADFNGGGILNNMMLTFLDSSSANDDSDSDAILGNNAGTDLLSYPEIMVTSPPAGELNQSYDFGFYVGGDLCGVAWNDADGEGDQEASESNLDSVIVIVLDPNNMEVARDTTSLNGSYFIENLPPNIYTIQVDTNLLSGYIYTLSNGIGNDELDSDVSFSGFIDNVSIVSGSSMCNYDIGLTTTVVDAASISGVVWDELNKDGLRIAPEENIDGIQVNLLDDFGFVLQTVFTNALGEYEFHNLTPNMTYSVQFLPPTNIGFTGLQDVGMDDTIDSDVNPATGISHAVIPLPNEEIENIDAGLCMLYTIGNLVWFDLNNNSIFDSNESVISGIQLFLLDGSTMLKLDSTITDANGKYLFTELHPGDYIVEVEVPSLYKSSDDLPSTPFPNQLDNDENGIGSKVFGTVSSGVISIIDGGGVPGDANWNETDHGQVINGMIDNTSNPKAYYTVDFGFKKITCKSNICLPVNIIRK